MRFLISGFLIGVLISYAYAQNRYTRKSITYLKMVFPPQVRHISDKVDFLTGFDLDSFLEKKIREAVEMPRFDYNPVGLDGTVDLETLAKLVKEYIDEIKVDRAKAEAKMDWRYKDLVVTAEDIRKIAESAFIYYPEIKVFDVDLIISYTKRGKRIHPKLSISVRLGVKVNYWRVDFDTGKPIKVAEIYSEHSEVVDVGRKELIPLPFPFSLLSPDVEFPETPLQAFVRCTEKTIYWLARKIHKETRRIPDFKLVAPIESVSFQTAYSPLTKKDGVYTDSDFEVIELIDLGNGRTEKKRVGWVRARKVGDDQSSFQILSGSAEVGQIISEYSLLGIGVMPFFNYGVNQKSFGFSLIATISLPRAFSVNISELYLLAGPEFLFPTEGTELNAYIGLRKKFYIRSLGINPELSFVFTDWLVDVRGKTAQGYSLGLKPAIGIEWFFSPRFSLYFSGGYRFASKINEVFYEQDGVEHSAQKTYNPSGPIISAGFEITIW